MGKSKDKGGEEKDAVQVKEQPADHDTTPSTASARPDADRPDYEELITRISVISKPLASKKLTKKLYKTVKKGLYEQIIFLICITLTADIRRLPMLRPVAGAWPEQMAGVFSILFNFFSMWPEQILDMLF